METKVNYAVVGLFVLVLGAALIGIVLWLSAGNFNRQAYATYYVYMQESVSGLNVNAPVKYHGVDVGRVRRIMLDPHDPERVRLVLDIVRDTPIKTDTVAVIAAQGLTGIAYVELSGGSRRAPLLTAGPGQRYPVIRTAPSLLGRLDKSLSRLLADLTQLSESANALLSPQNRQALSASLANLQKLTGTLAARAGTLDASLRNADRTLRYAAQASAKLPGVVDRIGRSADTVEHMADKVTRTSANVNAVVQDNRQAIRRFTHQTLPQTALLVGELRRLTTSLQQLSEELEHQPDLLLYGKRDRRPGPGE